MKSILFGAVVFLFTLVACKKNSSQPEPPSFQDGPMSAQLGKLINLGSHGEHRTRPVWGKNSDELFVGGSTEMLKIDIPAQKFEIVDNAQAGPSGKTNENSALIFESKRNNEFGIYTYNFNNNNIEKIIDLTLGQLTGINIAGNNIFVNSRFILPDLTLGPEAFYHLDMQTRVETALPGGFRAFSKDGSKTILNDSGRMCLFDNNSRTIVYSHPMNDHTGTFDIFYHNDVIKTFEIEAQSKFIIKDFLTDQVLQQYQSNFIILSATVSSDGTKLYYTGNILNGNSTKILIYDMITNTEKEIADLPFSPGGSDYVNDLILSDDNKKMVVVYVGKVYLKELN